MDQSKSNDPKSSASQTNNLIEIKIPKREFSIEFFVGLFAMAGVAAAGYLAAGLGDVKVFTSDNYNIKAEFDNISGLKLGASVEIAGVQVGEVVAINLKDPEALVTLNLNKNIQIRDDDIAAIRTKGIIGDRYIKISRGASDTHIPENGVITETESVVDLEDVIGKFIHSLDSEDKDDKDKKKKSGYTGE